MERARWLDLMTALGLPPSLDVFDRLVAAYAEEQRHYHTGRHVEECLRELDLVRKQLERPAEVELALWFHDAVYDTHKEDNEERSAVWAETFLREAGASPEVCTRVGALIRATAHLDEEVEPTGDTAFLLDIDLAVLGRPTGEFDLYDLRIRREYAWVPEDAYCEARADVFQGFLECETIYGTPFFRERYERRARTNLERMVEILGGDED